MFHRDEDEKDRSLEGASHAWVEALVPGWGWVAFDPTNNLVGGDRHIRVAIGRDYADVPPTRGVYKGEAQSELSVAVTVSPADSVAAGTDHAELRGAVEAGAGEGDGAGRSRSNSSSSEVRRLEFSTPLNRHVRRTRRWRDTCGANTRFGKATR